MVTTRLVPSPVGETSCFVSKVSLFQRHQANFTRTTWKFKLARETGESLDLRLSKYQLNNFMIIGYISLLFDFYV